jgi:hypothetical protein
VSHGILLAIVLAALVAYRLFRRKPGDEKGARSESENVEEAQLERHQQEQMDEDRQREEVRRQLEQKADEEERRWRDGKSNEG